MIKVIQKHWIQDKEHNFKTIDEAKSFMMGKVNNFISRNKGYALRSIDDYAEEDKTIISFFVDNYDWEVFIDFAMDTSVAKEILDMIR